MSAINEKFFPNIHERSANDAMCWEVKCGEWRPTSEIKRLWYLIVDFFNKDAKWVRVALHVDLYCRHMEKYENFDRNEHTGIKKITRTALSALGNAHKGSRLRAVKQLRRHEIALTARERLTKSEPLALTSVQSGQLAIALNDLESHIRSRLQNVMDHFWCTDYHGKLGNDTPWVDKRWQEVSAHLQNFPELVKALNSDSTLLDEFICWSFRDNCSVEIFAAFPTLVDILKPLYVAGRIGRASEGEESIITINANATHCHAQIRVKSSDGNREEFKNVPLIPEREISYGRGLTITTEKFAKALIERYNDVVGPLQLTPNGLLPFHSHRLTTVDNGQKAEFKDYKNFDEFWDAIPPYEVITRDEASKRCKDLNGDNYGLVIQANMDSPELALTGHHGYVQILLPDLLGENYRVYPIGRTTRESPKNIFEELKFLARTTASTVTTPDQGEEYSNRQNWGVGFAFDSDIDFVKETIFNHYNDSKDGNSVYSLFSENCHSFAFQVANTLLTKNKSVEETKDIKKSLEKLMVVELDDFDDPNFPSFSGLLFKLFLRYVRAGAKNVGAPRGKNLIKILRWLGGGRTFVANNGGEHCVCRSERVEKAQTLMPSVLRIRALQALKKDSDIECHTVRNRIYIPDGGRILHFLSQPRVA